MWGPIMYTMNGKCHPGSLVCSPMCWWRQNALVLSCLSISIFNFSRGAFIWYQYTCGREGRRRKIRIELLPNFSMVTISWRNSVLTTYLLKDNVLTRKETKQNLLETIPIVLAKNLPRKQIWILQHNNMRLQVYCCLIFFICFSCFHL